MRYVFPNITIASSIAKIISYVTEYPLTICQKEVAILTGYRNWKELNAFYSPKEHYVSYEIIKENISKTTLIKKIIKYRGISYLLNILNLKYKKNFSQSEVFLEDRTRIILDDIPNMDKGIFIFEDFNFDVLLEVELLILDTIHQALKNNSSEIIFFKNNVIFKSKDGTKTHCLDESKFLLLKNYLKKYANDNYQNIERVFCGKLDKNWFPECISNIRFVYDENALSFTKKEKMPSIIFKFLMKQDFFHRFDDIEKNKIKINSFFQKFLNINKNILIKKNDDNFNVFLTEIDCKNKYIINIDKNITPDQYEILSKISEDYNIPIYIFKNNLDDTQNAISMLHNCLKIYMIELKKHDYSLYSSSIKNDEVYMLCSKNLQILGALNQDEILKYDDKNLFFYNYYNGVTNIEKNKNIYSVFYNNNIFERTIRLFLRSRADIIFINNIQLSEIRIFIYLIAIGYQLKGYYNPGPYLTKKMIDKKIINSLK